MSSSSYSTSSKSSRSEAEFQKLSQTIATSIQKILQNGKCPDDPFAFKTIPRVLYSNAQIIILPSIRFHSIANATYGQSNWDAARFTRPQTTIVSSHWCAFASLPIESSSVLKHYKCFVILQTSIAYIYAKITQRHRRHVERASEFE